MSHEETTEQFLARNRESRLKFVQFWANYVKTHPDSDWSRQQRVIIDSQIRGARDWKWKIEDFMHMKGEKAPQRK